MILASTTCCTELSHMKCATESVWSRGANISQELGNQVGTDRILIPSFVLSVIYVVEWRILLAKQQPGLWFPGASSSFNNNFSPSPLPKFLGLLFGSYHPVLKLHWHNPPMHTQELPCWISPMVHPVWCLFWEKYNVLIWERIIIMRMH